MIKMFPSKSMVEYMSEMNRLFSQADHEEPPHTFNFNYRSPHQLVNRSSSSADSTSPDSYPDVSYRSDFRPQDSPRSSIETPFTFRRQRAIVGRKILGNTQQTPTLVLPAERMDMDLNFWQHEEPLPETPPESNSRNQLYGLFSPEHKSFGFNTPIKSTKFQSNFSPNFPSPIPQRSPTLSNRSLISPTLSNYAGLRSMTNPPPSMPVVSPNWSHSSPYSSQRHTSSSNYSIPFAKHSSIGASSSDEIEQSRMCTFCKKNGETPVVYMTHSVKEKVGNKNVVTCPILRSHVCATCGATGDNAHTITYCPVLRRTNNGKPLQSTTITLKNTRIKSNGKRRY